MSSEPALSPLTDTLSLLLGDSDRPVAVYAATWPIARAYRIVPSTVGPLVLRILRDIVGPNRTLLMPTFTSGFTDGRIDLDRTPGTTGILAETLRTQPESRRTASAFFSFAVTGPGASTLVALRPRDAWGEGSVYAWMEAHDAHCIMIGVPATTCSFIHRLEWLFRSALPYRTEKIFEGAAIIEESEVPLQETLLVRQQHPEALNDFSPVTEPFRQHGLRECDADGVGVSEIGARSIVAALTPLMQANPELLVHYQAEPST